MTAKPTTEIQRTPGPLTSTETANGDVDLSLPNGGLIATVQRGAAAYAPSIVRALNSHDALLAACEAAMDHLDQRGYGGDVYAQLRAALAQAKESPCTTTT